jgi:two-component system cell cycle response regulator
MHRLTHANSRMLYGYLVGAALFNFSFMGLLTTRLVGRLRKQSQQDALTGLMNRRALESRLQSEWQRVQRGGPAFAVLALDLDHFKRINDQHGHLAGDAVLAQLAERLRRVLREVDAVARTGGEEFVIMVPQATREGAARAGERLRHCVAAVPFDLPVGPTTVTVSVGVVLAAREDGELRHVLLRADRALYAAKGAGRNCVHVDVA